MAKPRLVLVTWVDSHQTAHWSSDKPATKPLVCQTAGFLVHDGKDAKTIAGSITEDASQRTGAMTIPTRAILSIRKLR